MTQPIHLSPGGSWYAVAIAWDKREPGTWVIEVDWSRYPEGGWEAVVREQFAVAEDERFTVMQTKSIL